MPYEATAAYPTPGRRAKSPEDIVAVRADPWDEPATAPQPRPSPLEDSLAYTADRLDRLEHMLGSLNGVVMRAGHQLEGLLTDGTYRDPDGDPVDPTMPTPEDRRSTIAKRVSALGDRADRLADATSLIERRVEAILDSLEV